MLFVEFPLMANDTWERYERRHLGHGKETVALEVVGPESCTSPSVFLYFSVSELPPNSQAFIFLEPVFIYSSCH